MPFGLFGARFDQAEFLFGLFLGLLIYWLIHRTRPVLISIFKWVRERIKTFLETFSPSSEEPYHVEIQHRLDNYHLANPLFPLRSILIPPAMLIPPQETNPLEDEPHDDQLQKIIPALPDWNVLEAIYNTPTMPITYLLQSEANVLITGELGAGKTTALAYLAFTCLSGKIQTRSKRLPIFLHVNELEIGSKSKEDPLSPIIEAVRNSSSASLARSISRFLRRHLRQGEVLLLLDGLDELPSNEIRSIADWLKQIHTEYPQHQIIVAGPPRGYDGILKAGLFPISIAPWNEQDLERYLEKWTNAWQAHVQPSLAKDRMGEIDPLLLNAWLRVSKTTFQPLEVTLRTWSFYVGDTKGPTISNCFQAYIRRILSPNEQHAAQAIALLWVRSRRSVLSEASLERRIPLQDLLAANVLQKRGKGQISFSYPGVGGFLAANALSLEKPIRLNFQPSEDWEPARAAIRFFSAITDASGFAKRCLTSTDDPLATGLFVGASWLRDLAPTTPWRNQILAGLGRILQDEKKPYGLRLRVLHALIHADEKSAAALFRRILGSETPQSQILGILGLGGLKLDDAVDELIIKIQSSDQPTIRYAASLALAAIGNVKALSFLGQLLLNGDEANQIFAAEALGMHPVEGFPMLRDALEMDSVRVRRAAVYGLGRTQKSETIVLLQKIQVEDNQAIVRNAASEVLEAKLTPKWKLTPPAEEISSLPWLIAFAAESGLGVTPGKGALEMLRRVLFGGKIEQKIAAMEAIAWYGGPDLILEVTQALSDEEPSLRHSAFETLWRLQAAGVTASPSKEPAKNTQGAPAG